MIVGGRISYTFIRHASGATSSAGWLHHSSLGISSSNPSAGAVRVVADMCGAYADSAEFFSFLWPLYPITWGICHGANGIHPESKMVFYGVLDILAKPVFIFIHIHALHAIDLSRFGLTGVGVGVISAVKGTRTGGHFNDKHGANTASGTPVNRPVDPLQAAAA
ncbi:hypothetical protein CALCODRAFT_303002 [Calocera cornea HHB12733]|uniref:Uncharacterized protein n=1 Tax=Calocera cornea HHB12733 TaxID=1353952 RepID=A0A165JJL3_9BASI|nr:hypothetical protein CALCODRAFT_303002 [Calocera cornea HHB12733]